MFSTLGSLKEGQNKNCMKKIHKMSLLTFGRMVLVVHKEIILVRTFLLKSLKCNCYSKVLEAHIKHS